MHYHKVNFIVIITHRRYVICVLINRIRTKTDFMVPTNFLHIDEHSWCKFLDNLLFKGL